ncbi:MAG: 50S ribosomal protein L22 [Planctomycetes bacterium]|nr:50S ribosomal protein L22 [Planctomycetota bacterium]
MADRDDEAEGFEAHLRFARISPRKVRLVVDLIRGKTVDRALALLRYNPRRGAAFVDKVLRSAWASAESGDTEADETAYVVAHARVDGGPVIYRGRPASMGRSVRIRKRTSHIHIQIRPREASAGRSVKEKES